MDANINFFQNNQVCFIMTDENSSFSKSTSGHWSSRCAEIKNKLQKVLEMRPNNDIELHVKDVSNRKNQMKKGDKEYKLSDFDIGKNEMTEELKKAEFNDLEDIVFRLELTYIEIGHRLDKIFFMDQLLDILFLQEDIKSKILTRC